MILSLLELKSKDWDCVLVDNGSEPSDLEAFCRAYPAVHFVRSEVNLGFAGGNNLGLPHAQGQYIFFINNDTEVPADLLSKLNAFVDAHPQFGAMSPLLIYHQRGEQIQYAGSTPLHPITMRNQTLGNGQVNRGQFEEQRRTAYAHGAAMLVPREVIDAIGPMREDYFLYYEELDWCSRMARAGYAIWFNGQAKVYHKESVSTGRNSPLKVYYLTRNRLLYARRNLSGHQALLHYLYFTAIALPKRALVHLRQREYAQLKALFKGYRDSFQPAKARPRL